MRTVRKVILAAAVLMTTACPARAGFVDGNELLRLSGGSASERLYALGYITGVADAGHGAVYCLPSTVTDGQIMDMTERMLREFPERRNESADPLIMRMLKAAWPCKKGGR